MNELWARLRQRPGPAVLMFVASLFANILGLASSLYVIQVLKRYVSYGVDATLATLTVGVILAIVFEFGFRWSRMKLAAVVSGRPDHELGIGAFGILATAQLGDLNKLGPGERREAVSSVEQVESGFSAPNLTALFDLPFSIIYVGAIYLFSPILAGIVLAFLIFVATVGVLNQMAVRPVTRKLAEHQSVGHGLIGTTSTAAESVRAFGAAQKLIGDWSANLTAVQSLRRSLARRQGVLQSMTQSAQGLMGTAVIGIGATLVVKGDLDVSMMIGANLLAARALQPITRFAQLSEALVKSRQALDRVRGLSALPVERGEGAALRDYSGALELRDVSFTPPGAPGPLFEELTVKIEPGQVVALVGRNGAGKTTLMRMMAGLVGPDRGQVLADGVDLRQIVPGWWRKQLVYLPQEPTFFNTTIRDNLKMLNPDLSDEALEALLERSGAARFVHETPNGLDTRITGEGLTLARGVRRRLAVARAMASGGRVVLFDEPTEGMDDEGVRQVYESLIQLARAGRTIVISSHDPQIIKGAQIMVDLDAKPKPTVTSLSKEPAGASKDWGAGARGRPPVKPKAAE